jgi:subtilase family serine protease
MTISFGGCESQNGLQNTDFVDTLAQDGAAVGITTLVSSGDSGAAGCDASFTKAPVTQIASINFICSSSYVTCVGGTEFNDTANPSLYWSTTNSSTLSSAISYIPEGGWNEPAGVALTTTNTDPYGPAASGGGVSVYIAKPTWQTGTGVPSGNFRFVPDVSLPASAHDGYFACLAYNGGNCANNRFESFSGTSAAAPGFAGIVALINTKVGTAAGNINPLLYSLATSTPSAFHDTTIATSGVSGCAATTPSMCNNSTPGPTTLTGGLSGYLLTTGFDEVTGLGSVDVANLVANAIAGTGGGGGTASFTLSASPTTLSVTPQGSSTGTPITGTATSTITATSTNSFAGSVAFTCAITPSILVPPTCAVSPTSVTLTANGTATSTLTISYHGDASPCTSSNNTGAPSSRSYGGIALAGLLLLVLPVRKRRSIRALAGILVLLGVGSLSGCGGGSSTPPVCNVVVGGTTAGSYTVTVTGTSGSITQTTTVALTVN